MTDIVYDTSVYHDAMSNTMSFWVLDYESLIIISHHLLSLVILGGGNGTSVSSITIDVLPLLHIHSPNAASFLVVFPVH